MDFFQIIIPLAILFFIYKFLLEPFININKNKEENRNENSNSKKYSEFKRKSDIIKNKCRYRIKKVFTNEELRFYFELSEHIKEKEDVVLLTKVRLADFVKHNEYKDFSRISQKHIDFLISDNKWNIKLLIELDWYSHNYKKTQISDEFKNELFNNLKIPLVRFKNHANFDFRKIDLYLS